MYPLATLDGVRAQFADSRLLRQAAFVGGNWVQASLACDVDDPADGTVIGAVPLLEQEHIQQAISAASEAFPRWAALLPRKRARVLQRWSELIRESAEELATIVTVEQGKPLHEARREIAYGADFIEWFAEEGNRLSGRIFPAHLPNSRVRVMVEPVGITAAITPWNFPAAMVARKAAAALSAGCPMIVKPAMETPFSALALAVLAEEADLPSGLLSIVTGDAAEIFATLVREPAIRAISFTGSTEVGRQVYAASALTVKRVSLELGGHAPFIVFDDVDVEVAAEQCIRAKFATGGQDCLAANRIYVHESIVDDFSRSLSERASALVVGHGLDPHTDIGPLTTTATLKKVEAHVQDAVVRGARLLAGGTTHPRGPRFYSPTVLGSVTDDMLIAKDETFGPVAPILRFSGEEEVIRRANASEFGLAAYVLTDSLSRAERMIAALEYGMVAVNTPTFTGAPVPFGGWKQSGIGREGAQEGIHEFLETKYACIGAIDA